MVEAFEAMAAELELEWNADEFYSQLPIKVLIIENDHHDRPKQYGLMICFQYENDLAVKLQGHFDRNPAWGPMGPSEMAEGTDKLWQHIPMSPEGWAHVDYYHGKGYEIFMYAQEG